MDDQATSTPSSSTSATGSSPSPQKEAPPKEVPPKQTSKSTWALLTVGLIVLLGLIVWMISSMLSATNESSTQGSSVQEAEQQTAQEETANDAQNNTDQQNAAVASTYDERLISAWYPPENSYGTWIQSRTVDPFTGESVQFSDKGDYVLFTRGEGNAAAEWVVMSFIDEEDPFALKPGVHFVNTQTKEMFSPAELATLKQDYTKSGLSWDVMQSVSDPNMFYVESYFFRGNGETYIGIQEEMIEEREETPETVKTYVVNTADRTVKEAGTQGRLYRDDIEYGAKLYDSQRNVIIHIAQSEYDVRDLALPVLEVPFDRPQSAGTVLASEQRGYTPSAVLNQGAVFLQDAAGPYAIDFIDFTAQDPSIKKIALSSDATFLRAGEQTLEGLLLPEQNAFILVTGPSERDERSERMVLYTYNAERGTAAYEDRVEFDLPALQDVRSMRVYNGKLYVFTWSNEIQYGGPSYFLTFNLETGVLESQVNMSETYETTGDSLVVIDLFSIPQDK